MDTMADMMNKLMTAKAGKAETIRVVFKKTVNIAQYETEVYEADTSVELEEGITGIERIIVSHILFAELEYGVLLKLALKGVITKQDMDKSIEKSEYGIKLLYDKAVSLGVQPDIEKYINSVGGNTTQG